MRDVGASWDFADVRDHYLRLLHGVDRSDEEYWERSRFVTGEVMAEVFGEWRRAASVTSGGIILWSRDLAPGSGWGVLDHRGEPKVALHHLRRALAPVAVWTTDEGLNGVSVHVANDHPRPLRARLRVALYRDGELRVEEAEVAVDVPAHTVIEHSVEAILGRFVDVGYAYRFGEPQQHLVVASLEQEGELARPGVSLPGRAAEQAPQRGRPRTDRLRVGTRRRDRGDDRVRPDGLRRSAVAARLRAGRRCVQHRAGPGQDDRAAARPTTSRRPRAPCRCGR